MLILGLLAFCQISFLPGYLLVRTAGNTFGFIQKVVYSFASSLILNYVLVFFLTALHWYTRPVLLALFCVEAALLLYVQFRHPNPVFQSTAGEQIKRSAAAAYHEFSSFVKSASAKFFASEPGATTGTGYARMVYAVQVVIVCLALYALGWAAAKFLSNIGAIFLQNDPVVSWNRWALDWYQNRFPVNTYAFYPQLITANWSIAYVFMAYPLQYIPTAIMPLFFIALLLLMLDLALLYKSSGYMLGIFAVAIFFQSALVSIIGEGYVDTAVAFMGFLSISCLFYADRSEETAIFKKYVIWGSFFAAGTVVTKHSGFYLLACYSLLALILLFKRRQSLQRKDLLVVVLSFLIFITIIAAPFFIMRSIEFAQGTHAVLSNYSAWNDAVLGSTFSERMYRSFLKLDQLFAVFDSTNFPWHAIALLVSILGLVFAFFEKKSRILVLIGLGWLALWSIYLSYDLRNLSIALPFMGLAIGAGLENMFYVDKVRYFANKINMLTITGLTAGAVILLSFFLNQAVLIDSHTSLEKTIGYPELNKRLYEYKKKFGMNKKILSNYQLLNYLPEFKGMLVVEYFDTIAVDPMKELAIFHKNLTDPDIGYILVPEDTAKLILHDIDTRVNSGDFERIFRGSGYIFLKINAGGDPTSAKNSLHDVDFVRMDVKVSGLRSMEGPYPQWDLPQFRWAEKSTFVINFWSLAEKAVEPVELSLSFRPQVRPSAQMLVKFNGELLKSYTVGPANKWKDDVLKFVPRKGINHIEISFPGAPPQDNLYMIFRTLSLRGYVST